VSNHSGSMGGHPLDDLAAYALTALDDAERREVDDHLAHCLTCQAELADHHETLAALSFEEAPPAGVWQRIASDIGAPATPDPHAAGHTARPAQVARPASGTADPHAPGSTPSPSAASGPRGDDTAATISSLTEAARFHARQASRLRWLAAAACLVAVAATAGVVGFALGSSGDDGVDEADITALAQQAAQNPGGVLGTLEAAGGQPVAEVVADEDGAYLMLEGLPDLPEGQAYQLWSLEEGRPVSLGMMCRVGTNTVAFRLPPTISQLALSVAPTRGEVAPTTDFSAAGTITPRT
jgi:hypothetical protein